jgi:O-antigen/teichoic acid export membrane protein
VRMATGPSRRSAIAFLTSSSLAQAACGSVTAVLATTLLGPHDRGLMVLGATTAGIAALVGGLGTGAALRSRLPGLTDAAHRRRLLATYTWCSLAAVVLAGALATIASVVSGVSIDAALATPSFLVAVLAATVAQVAMTQFPDVWFAAGRFRAGGGWAVATAAAGMAALGVGSLVHRSAATLLLAQALGMLAAGTGQAVRLRGAGLLAIRPRPPTNCVACCGAVAGPWASHSASRWRCARTGTCWVRWPGPPRSASTRWPRR